MDSHEAALSREAQFLALVKRHCPQIVPMYTTFWVAGDPSRELRKYGRERSGRLLARLLGIVAGDTAGMKFYVGPPEPFEQETRRDLEITVVDPRYLESVERIAADYEQETRRKATVLKGF